ncbi:hypothetical protein AB0M32_51135 [Streptomyces sp. NPDC051985]|uniref:hypothetical protein n=1 Tax=Streptomyces sp. NPDC051985 TaxID=3155807 RepID=UPI003420A48F
MLPEFLVELAASGGTAVAAAAGTDAWTETRVIVARLMGRDGHREELVLQRLDQTAAEVTQVTAGDSGTALEQVRGAQSRSWQTRFADLLQDLPEAARDEAVEELQGLVAHVRQHGSGSGASASSGGLAVEGNVSIEAHHNSVAAGVVNGGVRMDPPKPGASQD